MGFREFFYGPSIYQNIGGFLWMRPSVVDMDTIRDAAADAEAALNAIDALPDSIRAVTSYSVDPIRAVVAPREVRADELDNLGPGDRQRLSVSISRGDARVGFRFGPTIAPHVLTEIKEYGDEQKRALQISILTRLVEHSPPVFRPELLKPAPPLLLGVTLVALWAWLILSTPIPLPALLLGWLGVGTALAFIVRHVRRLPRPYEMPAVGNRVRLETREKTISRRIDARRDLKVALWTALGSLVVGLLVGFAVAALTNAFGLTA